MTVYIELVFIENLIIDRFLLLMASKIVHIPLKNGWLGAIAGALYACITPLIYYGMHFQKVLVLILMCAIAFKTFNIKSILFTSSAVAAGSACLFGLLNLVWGSFSQGYFYEDDIFFIVALLSVVASYLVYKLTLYFSHTKKLGESLCTVTVSGKTVSALIDSGNSLYYKDMPVVLINKKIIEETPERLLIIPYSAVGSQGALLGFKPEKITVTYSETTKELQCVVALCDHSFNDKFDALMHPDLIRECV